MKQYVEPHAGDRWKGSASRTVRHPSMTLNLIRKSPNKISIHRCLDANLVNFIVVIVYFLLEFQINHVKIPLVFAEMGILPFPLDLLT